MSRMFVYGGRECVVRLLACAAHFETNKRSCAESTFGATRGRLAGPDEYAAGHDANTSDHVRWCDETTLFIGLGASDCEVGPGRDD